MTTINRPDECARGRRHQMRQCPTHGLDLVLMDPLPGAPVMARFVCPDPYCGHIVRRNRFALFLFE